MIRALVERLPVMVAPRWVRTRTQPIAVEDLVAYLLAGLDLDTAESRVFEIGGADVVSYEGLMREYARQRDSGGCSCRSRCSRRPSRASGWGW